MPVRFGLLGLLTIALTLYAPAWAFAVTIRTIEITQNQEAYHVTFDVLLATEPEKTWLLLSDYHQWPLLSENLEESKLLELFPDGRQRNIDR